MSRIITPAGASAGAGLGGQASRIIMPSLAMILACSNHYHVQCHDKFGNLKWEDEIDNLVVTEGRNHLLDVAFKSGAQITSWYVGITTASPTFAAGDTMASHGGWTEEQDYSEANRQTLTLGTISSGSVDNSASKAQFSINANAQSIGGLFIVSNNTKGGTTGTLYGGGAFTGGNKAADSGDTLSVQATLAITSS